ncbi:hypothetical protein B0H14DRAFT_2612134 [Mycena olivaceomarginata]|nr:hypothetical protein B0H14DRAFT_2612134 [Mycena olivaceomarginata]
MEIDGVLMDNLNLPENWIWQSGVLVGIGPGDALPRPNFVIDRGNSNSLENQNFSIPRTSQKYGAKGAKNPDDKVRAAGAAQTGDMGVRCGLSGLGGVRGSCGVLGVPVDIEAGIKGAKCCACPDSYGKKF